ncbi:MAG: pyruvate ferredoxin oxidoreductase [Deltaproteobacteria bacterium]|nr:pyruvate ferredoxin oxidoreductase [Deltaproteobacteria bacterium]MBW2306015.1 pyruvate ferredoxin oxidoreductase [Deltaproteobacteria bacterium]
MARWVGMEISLGISEAVKACDADIVAAYPITPQTHIVEHLSELVAEGELDAEFIPVESEHSAMSVCIGTAAVGARTYTATSAQGLALMHEMLFLASAMRMPIVMTVVNRALSGPISIWNDHSDIMAERDTGWIQTFAENGQEAFDLTVHAFRVAEDPEVALPVMVNIDGFVLSHVIEAFEILEREEVSRYLPSFKPRIRLDTKNPITMGPVGIPDIYTEAKAQQEYDLQQSKRIIEKAWKEFGDLFGRYYHPVELYRTEDADVVMLIMGSLCSTAQVAVDEMRAQGIKAGLAKLRLWRPFPLHEIQEAFGGLGKLIIVDRCLSFGGKGGPVASEIKSALYSQPDSPAVVEYIAGLGGRDVRVEDFQGMIKRAMEDESATQSYQIVGVR